MIIRCWGARGSISVSGKEYVKYGGDTSCIEVKSSSGDLIIIDAGTGIRALGNRLVREKRFRINLLLTHAHWDHLSGFPFFHPLYRKESRIKVFGPQPTQASLKSILSRAMSSPYFPVEFEDIEAKISFNGAGRDTFSIGSVRVRTIPLSHPNEGFGYRIEESGKAFVFLTDNELGYSHPGSLGYGDYVEFAKGADLLFHDAEYSSHEYRKTKRWGHSVYLDTVKFALDAEVKALGLFHHHQDRTDREVDAIERRCREFISRRGSRMKCFAVRSGMKVRV